MVFIYKIFHYHQNKLFHIYMFFIDIYLKFKNFAQIFDGDDDFMICDFDFYDMAGNIISELKTPSRRKHYLFIIDHIQDILAESSAKPMYIVLTYWYKNQKFKVPFHPDSIEFYPDCLNLDEMQIVPQMGRRRPMTAYLSKSKKDVIKEVKMFAGPKQDFYQYCNYVAPFQKYMISPVEEITIISNFDDTYSFSE